jgi:uncharacterized protein
VKAFQWPLFDEFLDRAGELARLEEWWAAPERMPISLYGRRRVGKSWLFRRFAHGKPAVVLVAHRLAPGAQLDDFAVLLEPLLGLRPALADVPELFRVLFRAARDEKLLAVIDEFPWLLPTTEASIDAELSAIQAVMEQERDHSKLKLILCGSMIGQMESLNAERNPLHGRLIPLRLRALAFDEAALFLETLDPIERFERFAIAGGMPRYLAELSGASLRTAICRKVLDRDAPLFDEARTILDQELREAKVYFSILRLLADGDKEIGELANATRIKAAPLSKYLSTLENLRIVSRRLPVGSHPGGRGGHWHLEDAFFRFWFRFVFPYQDELESGLGSGDLYDAAIGGAPLAEHVSIAFEQWCRDWTLATHGQVAQVVGPWWGPSLNKLRRTGERQTEEIDLVGLSRGRVTLVGEAKWRNQQADVTIVRDLVDYRIPALGQAGFKVAQDCRLLVFSKSGYSRRLVAAAAENDSIQLVDVDAALRTPNQPTLK